MQIYKTEEKSTSKKNPRELLPVVPLTDNLSLPLSLLNKRT